jgi:hypothetical protein
MRDIANLNPKTVVSRIFWNGLFEAELLKHGWDD